MFATAEIQTNKIYKIYSKYTNFIISATSAIFSATEIKQMNKSIFKKIKKSNLQSIHQSPSSQEEIQFMSVQDMEKTLLTHINSSKNQYSSQVVINSQDTVQNKIINQFQPIHISKNQTQTSFETKKIPDLMQQNDKLKDEIQKLKNQRKLILSQYESISVPLRNSPQIVLNSIPQKSRQFSFRKSVQNVDRILSATEKQKPIQRQIFYRQRQYGSIHEQNVPTTDSNGKLRRSSSRRFGASLQMKGIGQNLKNSKSKEAFSTLEERFYEYCKNEMVQMNSENTKLTLKIGELQKKITTLHKQYELLQKENLNLKQLNQLLEQKLSNQADKITKLSQEMSSTLIKKQEIVQNEFKLLNSQLNQLRTNQEKLRKEINSKEVQITVLKAQISQKSLEAKSQSQLISKNVSLQNQVNELLLKNRKISEKFRRMPVIDHLWEIKEVEYENLINLIQQQKLEIENYQNFKNSQNYKSYPNAFDLTFSKDKNRK